MRPARSNVSTVHERIVEVPYAFRALSGLAPGSRVLDVGSAESTVALSLAALGYRVTALDLRPYPFEHPLLEVVAAPLEEVGASGGAVRRRDLDLGDRALRARRLRRGGQRGRGRRPRRWTASAR